MLITALVILNWLIHTEQFPILVHLWFGWIWILLFQNEILRNVSNQWCKLTKVKHFMTKNRIFSFLGEKQKIFLTKILKIALEKKMD